MANIITAGNSTNGGTAISTDTSGTLNIVTGSGSGTTAVTVDGSGNVVVTGTLTASGGVATSVKAWVNFNGSGTVAIRASNNVTSITDNGTGDYTINITTALSDANYAAVGSAENGRILQNNTSRTNTTTAVNVITRNVADANGDSSVVAVSVFR
jgi:hypothetical protein